MQLIWREDISRERTAFNEDMDKLGANEALAHLAQSFANNEDDDDADTLPAEKKASVASAEAKPAGRKKSFFSGNFSGKGSAI